MFWGTIAWPGIATVTPSQGTSPNTLVEAVDQALYQVKVEGRSQYKLAEN
jgi:PleD family two-component response regulator